MRTHRRSPARRRLAVLAGAVWLAGGAGSAEAQRVINDFPRVDQSDVSGVTVTSGDLVNLYEPGTAQTLSCPVAWGIRAQSREFDLALARAELPTYVSPIDVVSRTELRALMRGTDRRQVVARAFETALSSGNQSTAARRAARGLVASLQDLDVALSSMDPANPGTRGPTRLASAIAHFNDFVRASSGEFLRSPPAEFRAIQSFLSDLSIAAMENQGRAADLTSVDEEGLACAAPRPVAPVRIAPVRAIGVCMMLDQELREVSGILDLESGDTLAIWNGGRVPFRQVYPDDPGAYAATRPWFFADPPLPFRGDDYKPFGLSRLVRPEEVERIGEYQGVSVFRLRGEGAETIYLPVRGCEVQPFRKVTVIRVRG